MADVETEMAAGARAGDDPDIEVAEPAAPRDRPEGPSNVLVSEDWALDELAETRLRYQLARSPVDVVGVAATTGSLEPGDSYRSKAARLALEPLTAISPKTGSHIVGAVALRPGVAHVVDDQGIRVLPDQGTLLVDPGAFAHDPWQSAAPLGHATDIVRAPFPRAPVVLFIGVEPDLDVADWTRGMVNDLLRQGIDARFAVTQAPEGLHLSRPCLPGEAALESIAPHVVVPLDDSARATINGWWGANRTTMIIEHVPDMTLGLEPVSWRLGRARGRVRGRIGPVVKAPELAAFVDRLCGGPQPLPPIDDEVVDRGGRDWRDSVTAVVTTIRTGRTRPSSSPRRRSVLAVDGGPGPTPDHRLESLVDRLHAIDNRVEIQVGDDQLPATAPSADLLILRAVTPTDELLSIIDERRRAGRVTVLSLAPDDFIADEPAVVPFQSGTRARLRLYDSAAALVDSCRWVMAPGRAAADAVADPTIRRLVVPTLLTRAHAGELRSLRLDPSNRPDNIVGWQVDAGVDGREVAVVAQALSSLLTSEPDLRLVVVDQSGSVGEAIGDHLPVERIDRRPDAWIVNHWVAQVWTASAESIRRTGDLSPLVDASEMAVPTVVAGNHPALGLIHHPSALVVRRADEVDAWLDRVRPAATEPGTRTRRAHEVLQIADALFGAAACALVARRFMGWIAVGDGRG